MNHSILSLSCCLLISFFASSQSIEWNGSLSTAGIFSSEDTNPFWLVANNDGRYGLESQFSGLGEVTAKYALSERTSLEAGVALFYRDEVADEFQRRDLFVRFKNQWLKATLGSERPETKAQGLSATNKNFLYSGNTRPLAGILLEANNPIKISKTFGLDWGIGHYELNDDRYVNDVRVHYKRLALLVQFNENNKLRAQVQHFAQWAGTSPTFGELPGDFDAFVDVFFARKAPEINEEGEILNAVGNHLGSYLLDYEFNTSVGEFSIYHEHPYEDGSGTRLANFPDGVWGIHFVPANKKVFGGILYEYIVTTDQSSSNVSGVDNYFRNNVYRSGWSYEGAIIGMPFILIDPTIEVTDVNSPITSNREQVHHFGVTGTVKKVDWTFKSSIVSHLGSFMNPFDPELNLWHNYLSLFYDTETYGAFTLFAGLDSGALIDTNFGGGLEYRYTF